MTAHECANQNHPVSPFAHLPPPQTKQLPHTPQYPTLAGPDWTGLDWTALVWAGLGKRGGGAKRRPFVFLSLFFFTVQNLGLDHSKRALQPIEQHSCLSFVELLFQFILIYFTIDHDCYAHAFIRGCGTR